MIDLTESLRSSEWDFSKASLLFLRERDSELFLRYNRGVLGVLELESGSDLAESSLLPMLGLWPMLALASAGRTLEGFCDDINCDVNQTVHVNKIDAVGCTVNNERMFTAHCVLRWSLIKLKISCSSHYHISRIALSSCGETE